VGGSGGGCKSCGMDKKEKKKLATRTDSESVNRGGPKYRRIGAKGGKGMKGLTIGKNNSGKNAVWL